MTISPSRHALGPIALAALLAIAGCTPQTPDSGRIAVTAGDDSCVLSALAAPSGSLTFSVTNAGSDVTEFYLLAGDEVRIIGEVENIGPGLTRDLVVVASPGEYVAACKPGMIGDGIRHPFTVTSAGTSAASPAEGAAELDAASAAYLDFVRDQVADLVTATGTFAELYVAGRDDEARALYPRARLPWERIEPVAESFGDLDPRLDLREADLLPGEDFTGWHHIEKTLWPPAEGYVLSAEERASLANHLVADTATLAERVNDPGFTIEAFQMGNGAKELLDEVATGKVTGEEEAWSHTDLWDFSANVGGARTAFEFLRPVVDATDPALAGVIATRFAELAAFLANHGSESAGFAPFDTLAQAEIRELARAVDALGEPLSRLTAAVVAVGN